MPGQQILLDTSPLITACTFKAEGQLIVEYLLAAVSVVVSTTVAAEATVNPTYSDAAVIQALLEEKRVTQLIAPSSSLDSVIDSYNKLGQGERDTIRLALALPGVPIVLDDYLAFVVASRFGLTPMLLLDLLVSLVQNGRLEKKIASDIVEQIAGRYSLPFVNHTRYKLNG